MPNVPFHVSRLGFALWASPVCVLARTENFNYAPINLGTAHISHGTVYIKRRILPLILPLLSASSDQHQENGDFFQKITLWQRHGRGDEKKQPFNRAI